MKKKTSYRIRNWSTYNAALIARGSLTLWVDEAAVQAWRYTGPTQRGGQYVYAEAAIKCVLTLRVVYHLALRATEGLARSLFALLDTALPVPSYSTLSRRAAEVEVALGALPRSGPLHLVVDSSGFKVYGEGEWKVRQHGVGKRRTWRKIHLAVDESAKDIIGIEVTTAEWGDSEVFAPLLAQVDGEVSQVSGDGTYDTQGTHAAIAARGAKATIPPREGAVAWGGEHPRDAILAEIAAKGRPRWKQDAGYHRRSLAENMMYRLKQLGERLFSREFDRQVVEAHVRVAILNQFTYLGMPQSVRVGQVASAA
jgi:transposase